MAAFHAWLPAMRRYLAVIAVGNLVWETAQMPLYTLWRTGSMQEIAFAVVHCTGGDVLIAAVSLFGSLLLFGGADWPRSRFLPVAAATVALGLGYTIYSERLNTASNAWAYSGLMLVLPGLGTGLAPLAQWLVVPLLAFAAARPPLRAKKAAVQASLEPDLPAMRDTTSHVAPDHLPVQLGERHERAPGRASARDRQPGEPATLQPLPEIMKRFAPPPQHSPAANQSL